MKTEGEEEEGGGTSTTLEDGEEIELQELDDRGSLLLEDPDSNSVRVDASINGDDFTQGEVEYVLPSIDTEVEGERGAVGIGRRYFFAMRRYIDRISSQVFPPGTLWSSIFELLGATLGAGCLSLPSAIKDAGLIVGMQLCS